MWTTELSTTTEQSTQFLDVKPELNEDVNDRQGHNTDRQIPKICLTYTEAAWSLGISERNLWAMISRGQLPVVELGGKVLFDPDDLYELKRKHKTVRNPIR